MKINGEKLANARAVAGVTRSELAMAADLSHARIWQLETEVESNINLNVANAIAKKLKIHAKDLQ